MLWRRIASQSEVIRAILLSDSPYVVCVWGGRRPPRRRPARARTCPSRSTLRPGWKEAPRTSWSPVCTAVNIAVYTAVNIAVCACGPKPADNGAAVSGAVGASGGCPELEGLDHTFGSELFLHSRSRSIALEYDLSRVGSAGCYWNGYGTQCDQPAAQRDNSQHGLPKLSGPMGPVALLLQVGHLVQNPLQPPAPLAVAAATATDKASVFGAEWQQKREERAVCSLPLLSLCLLSASPLAGGRLWHWCRPRRLRTTLRQRRTRLHTGPGNCPGRGFAVEGPRAEVGGALEATHNNPR